MYCLRLSLPVFFLLLVVPLHTQPLSDQLNAILASPPDTHQVRQLTVLMDSLRQSSTIKLDTLFEEGLTLADDINDQRGLAQLHHAYYQYLFTQQRYEVALPSILKTREYAEKTNQGKLLRRALLDEVAHYEFLGDTKNAIALASPLIRRFNDAKDLIGAAEANSFMARLIMRVGDMQRTMVYDSTAYELAVLSGDLETIGNTAASRAFNLRITKNLDLALFFAMEAVRATQGCRNTNLKLRARNCRALVYGEMNKFEEALADYRWIESNNKSGVAKVQVMINKGGILMEMNRYDEAEELLLSAVELIKGSTNNPHLLVLAYSHLRIAGLSTEQRKNISYYNYLIDVQRDSIQAEANVRSLLELEEKYKAEDRESKITVQEAKLNQQRILLFASIGVALIAVMSGLAFFLFNRKLRHKNDENEKLVKDKETLISEIHHRVKNNLQVISSLLQLQRRRLKSDDEKGREALLESQSRVSAMGLIHSKLYQGNEVTSVHMPDYLEDLGETLLDAYQLEEQVEIFYNVANIRLDVDEAIPLGLIINELVTNSIKYAFPKGREGTIEIALHRENDRLHLTVIDNGVGVVAAEKRTDSTSFGSNLIGLLTKKLNGTLRVLKGRGYGVEIVFKD